MINYDEDLKNFKMVMTPIFIYFIYLLINWVINNGIVEKSFSSIINNIFI